MTVPLNAHPVDLGAHWLHAGPVNPLVRLGEAAGERLRRAPLGGPLVVGGRAGRACERAALDAAFARIDRALTLAARLEADRPAAAALPPAMGPWARRAAAVHGLVSGRPLAEVSLQDFPSLEYAENRFIAGGFGAYLARLAAGLPIRLGAAVRAIDWSGPEVQIESEAGLVRARAVLVTLPIMVLQRGGVRFTPALPAEIAKAIAAFRPGIYEHIVLHWPATPFRGPDELATLVGGRIEPPGFLARIDGTPFHYLEVDEPTARALDGRGPDRARRFARELLAGYFGHRALADLTIPAVTEWRRDPLALASWAVVPPGAASARKALRAPIGERLWFAGEALSQAQWGTVGGAWAEGERAADAIAARLRRG